ncbi:MAG: malectin domain-containing carbohydrate-binding protein [Desulfosarcinaceae bacterium]|nr:malectin domain-containing carbohydrate-binding protein [Desulfosarcinaceae bacterium]
MSNRNQPQHTVKGLPADCDFVFVVTAYTQSGVESGFSNEAIYRASMPVPGDEVVGNNPPPPATPDPPQTNNPGDSASDAVVRVNCGGGRYWDRAGNEWSADFGYNTGRVASTSKAIAGTSDDTLYQSNRWNSKRTKPLEYAFKLANGAYTVNLHFAETYRRASALNERVFDIQIENQFVAQDFDIFAEAGGNTALKQPYAVSVTDGELNIKFLHGARNPQINAIEVVLRSAGQGQDITAPDAPRQLTGTASAAGDRVTLKWKAAIDTGGSGIDGYVIYRNNRQIGYAKGTTFTDDTVEAGRTYAYEVSAVDKALNESETTAVVQVSTGAGSAPNDPIRVNAGGKAYTDRQGYRWLADTGYNTGNTTSVSGSIARTRDDLLYRTNRKNARKTPKLAYAFDVANGDYLVKLHFAETDRKAFAKGKRNFGIHIEDRLVERSLDIYGKVGRNAALIKSYTVTVTDGQLEIVFSKKTNDPVINAIEVLPVN